MSENLKTEWEGIHNGERTEIGLVQVDIVRHSRIKASERTLKKAKDIFSDEIERIAVDHGGKLFKWEGDGGSFMFLMRDGENFNKLVKAALAMLESMPAINKKIVDETDLKDTIHVRLSCDSGIAEFDKNPTRIAADFINSFIKNEREISLPDNVCITERVHKQLDAQLRARFSLYKHSREVRSDIYSLPRNKSLIRWVAFAGVIGIVLGLICALILARNGLWVKPAKPIVFTGGGTVYLYLTAMDPDIFKNLSDYIGIDVLPLQAPTDTGASQFAHAFDQTTVLAMASKQLGYTNLSRPESGQADGNEARRPKAVFEVYLGDDPLEMLLVAQAGSTVDQDFGEIISKIPISEDPKVGVLAATDLTAIPKWKNGDYNIYVGMDGSATKAVWEQLLNGLPTRNLNSWDIQNLSSINLHSNKPNIFLGSKVLLDAKMKEGVKTDARKITILNASNKPEIRSLYLYGFLDNSENNKTSHGGVGGYDLPKHVTEVLKFVFDLLEQSTPNTACLQEQKNYFHLNEIWTTGWVEAGPENIFRADKCPGRPEK